MPGPAPIRVLLVDDHEHMRRLGAIWLLDDTRFALAGECGDGYEAVELAGELQPDAVLLDLHLPTMSGLTTLRFINERSPDMVVVVLTGDPELAEEAEARGADAVFVKGDPLITVLDEIADQVERRRGETAAS